MTSEYFNRYLKRQYSWLLKGVTSSIICTVVTGMWSMISAILSNEEFLCLKTENTGNARNFWNFLCILVFTIENTKMRQIPEWIITLDNASTHHAKYSISKYAELNINIIFFAWILTNPCSCWTIFPNGKNKIRQQIWDNNVWFNNLKGILEIFLLSRTEENLGFIACG